MKRLIGILALACALALPARAADIAAFKTNYVEIAVKADDALKTYPALFDNLSAEGKAWAAKARMQAAEEYRTNRATAFHDNITWSFDRSYGLRSAINHYISVTRSDETFEGGAHPAHDVNTILWDTEAKKRISVRPFFIEMADNGPTMSALAKMVREAVAREKKARGIDVSADLDSDTWLKNIEPSLLRIGALALAPSDQPGKSSGLIAYFSPAVVGPYVEGQYAAFVPWREFKPSLSSAGLALFGGSRPKDDKDK